MQILVVACYYVALPDSSSTKWRADREFNRNLHFLELEPFT